jgi:hypothetical protein
MASTDQLTELIKSSLSKGLDHKWNEYFSRAVNTRTLQTTVNSPLSNLK